MIHFLFVDGCSDGHTVFHFYDMLYFVKYGQTAHYIAQNHLFDTAEYFVFEIFGYSRFFPPLYHVKMDSDALFCFSFCWYRII